MVRNGKRKDTEVDSDKSKKQRAGSSSVVLKAGEYCEGCGNPRIPTITRRDSGYRIQDVGTQRQRGRPPRVALA